MASRPKLIQDGTQFMSGAGGRVIDRYYIEDMTPGPDLHIRATFVAGLPIENQPHRRLITYLLRNKRGMVASDTQAFVDCIYVPLNVGPPDGSGGTGPIYTARNSSIIQQDMTRRGATIKGKVGKSIFVRFKAEGSTNEDTKVGEAPRYVVFRTLVASARYQLGPVPEKIHDVIGSINDSPWRGKESRTWMLAGVEDVSEGVLRNGVETFRHEITFWHNAEGWDAYIFYRDQKGNIPFGAHVGFIPAPAPGGIVDFNGSTRANVQTPVNFDEFIDLDL